MPLAALSRTSRAVRAKASRPWLAATMPCTASICASASVKYASGRGTEITLRTEEANDEVLIHIGDDGPGIPTAKLDEIFEPFVQLAGGLTKRHGGMGLGLAISRGLAREMHGDLTVVSKPGQTTFTISLPRAARVLNA